MFFKIIANFTGKHLCLCLLLWSCRDQKCNFIKKRSQHRLLAVKFANFLRAPCLTEHLQWLLLKVSGLQSATLLKTILRKRSFSVSFCNIFKNIFSFDRTPPDDCFLCLSVNFETFFRTLVFWVSFTKHFGETVIETVNVQVVEFQLPDTVKNYFTVAFQAFYTISGGQARIQGDWSSHKS